MNKFKDQEIINMTPDNDKHQGIDQPAELPMSKENYIPIAEDYLYEFDFGITGNDLLEQKEYLDSLTQAGIQYAKEEEDPVLKTHYRNLSDTCSVLANRAGERLNTLLESFGQGESFNQGENSGKVEGSNQGESFNHGTE